MASTVTGAARFVERELYAFRKLWRSTAFTSVVSPLLFLAGFGVGLGGLIDQRQGALVDGLSYLDFVTPGLLAGTAMQVGAGGSMWPILAGSKWMRYYHAMVATPISASSIHVGHTMWTAVRVTMSAACFLVVATLFGGVNSWWALLAPLAAILTGTAFSSPMAAYSAAQESDVSFPVVMRLGIAPLFLFSDTFFPVEQLPSLLRPLAYVSPLWHGVQLCRSATTGVALSLGEYALHVGVLLAFVAVGLAIGRRTFTRLLAA